jgi:hypothetical protein
MKAVDGIYVTFKWEDLEPRPQQYDWTLVDQIVDKALQFDKKLSIAVGTGAYAPSWLYDSGVEKSTFVVGHHGGRRGRCRTVDIPWPWDANYQKAYARMMRGLADHLRKRPGAYEAVRIVKVTGINQITNETRMPAASRVREDSCSGAAAPIWQAAEYRPSKVVDAWKQFAIAVESAFPDKLLAINVLENNGFPALDERGELVRRGSSAYIDVKKRIIEAGIRLLPGRFAVQWNGLSTRNVAPSVLEAAKGGAIIGWQTNLHRGREGAGCDAVPPYNWQPCDTSTYRETLEFGIKNGGRYLEIWAPDAERFPEAIEAVRRQMS